MMDLNRFHLADYPQRFELGGTWMDTVWLLGMDMRLFDYPDAKLAGFCTVSLGEIGAVLGLEWYVDSPAGRLFTSGLFELDYNNRGYCMRVSWSAQSQYTSSRKLFFRPLMCHPAFIQAIPLRHQWKAFDNPDGYSL